MNASRMFAWIKSIASRIRTWRSPADVDQEFSSELESHLEMLTNENIRRGMSCEEAKRAARIRLGGATQLQETNRELRGLPVIETFLQDARYALRVLRRTRDSPRYAFLLLRSESA